MEKIFDTHAHYGDDAYKEDLDAVVTELKKSCFGVINCGTSYESSKNYTLLAERFNGFFHTAIGIHPEELPNEFNKEYLVSLAKHPSVVAIGEIGLDYHYEGFNKEKQKEFFINQLLLAKELDLPVIIHDRDAHGDTMEILQKHKPKGVLHCFSGSAETAKEALNLGLYLGVGGVVTFKNAQKTVKVVEALPINKLLLETDAPYLSPEPFRGKRNLSSYIIYVAQKIAEIKNLDADTVIKASRENTKNLFGI